MNPHFVAHVKIAASADRPIALICRSGNRTLDAGDALEKADFTQFINVLYGFEEGVEPEPSSQFGDRLAF